jgi:hypothetical protein
MSPSIARLPIYLVGGNVKRVLRGAANAMSGGVGGARDLNRAFRRRKGGPQVGLQRARIGGGRAGQRTFSAVKNTAGAGSPA